MLVVSRWQFILAGQKQNKGQTCLEAALVIFRGFLWCTLRLCVVSQRRSDTQSRSASIYPRRLSGCLCNTEQPVGVDVQFRCLEASRCNDLVLGGKGES